MAKSILRVASSAIAIPSLAKFYLDGTGITGDTYMVESSANVLDLYAGNVNTLKLNATGAAVTGTLSATSSLGLAATQKLYFDGVAVNGNTYLVESSADVLDLYAGGVNTLKLSSTSATVNGNLILPKAAGKGIKIEGDTYTWRDLEGVIQPEVGGAGSPTWTTWSGNVKEWKFIANDVIDLKFHWPHDHAPDTDIFIHIHWSHNGSAISGGSIVANYRWIWGKRDGTYSAERSLVHTVGSLTGKATLTGYIEEIQLSAAAPNTTPGSYQIDTQDLEPDGLLKMSVIVTGIPTVTAGDFFIEYIDIHYQSTNIGTKNKASNFYA